MPDTKPDRKAIADRLRLARDQAGLSQGQVAEQLGFHRPTISEIEAGRRKVSVDELVRFAELYHVSSAWLAQGASRLAGEDADRIELAARELARLKPEDVDAVLRLLRSLRGTGERGQ